MLALLDGLVTRIPLPPLCVWQINAALPSVCSVPRTSSAPPPPLLEDKPQTSAMVRHVPLQAAAPQVTQIAMGPTVQPQILLQIHPHTKLIATGRIVQPAMETRELVPVVRSAQAQAKSAPQEALPSLQ